MFADTQQAMEIFMTRIKNFNLFFRSENKGYWMFRIQIRFSCLEKKNSEKNQYV